MNTISNIGMRSTNSPSDSNNKTGSPQDPLTSKGTFLQLLVAQLKNQDPLNPADGVQFLTQLTQFSSLEQTMELTEQVTGIRQDLQQWMQKEGQQA